ncbi:MAG: ABC transporter permease [Deltaproteobacteria bacterium]|nr:ABC transporter permease [Deltaproteobacteria bacterium]
MTARAGAALVRRNVVRSRSHFVFAGIGLVVGSATLAFFLALSGGAREKILNRLYPVNQVEFQIETVRLFGLGIEVPSRLDEATLAALRGLPGVAGVYPKQRTKFPARLWGGRDVLGYEARLEAFLDGIDPVLVRDELRAAEREVLGAEEGRTVYWSAFRDREGERRIACELSNAAAQTGDDAVAIRGTVTDGADRKPCPEGTYCAATNVLSARGFCEAPVPALVSPFLLEVYNSVAATAMGLRKLSGLEVMLGVQFAVLFGESYFAPDERVDRRVVKRARIVGFSNKAMEFGVTVPLPYVERANLALRGREEASEYTSVIVETHRNEDVPAIVDDARVLGLTLSPRSEEGRKAANVLLVLTIVFAMVSVVILGISAINITHTFLMLVTERRAEIAVWRAVGATLLDVRLLVLGEALVLGLAGGASGLAVAYGLSRAANAAASGVLAHVPGSPSDLFVFSLPVIAAGVACAVLFAVVGAWVPASRAARTDPATVLSQG